MNGTFFFAIVDPFFPTFQRTAGDTKEFFLNLLKKHPYNQLEKISYKTSIHILMGNWHFTGKPLKKKLVQWLLAHTKLNISDHALTIHFSFLGLFFGDSSAPFIWTNLQQKKIMYFTAISQFIWTLLRGVSSFAWLPYRIIVHIFSYFLTSKHRTKTLYDNQSACTSHMSFYLSEDIHLCQGHCYFIIHRWRVQFQIWKIS